MRKKSCQTINGRAQLNFELRVVLNPCELSKEGKMKKESIRILGSCGCGNGINMGIG